MKMKRSMGFTGLAVLLLLLAVSGFANGWLALTGKAPLPAPTLWAAVSLVYGVLALAAAVGLWRVTEWAWAAFLAWTASAVLTMALYVTQAQHGHPQWGPLAYTLGLLGLAVWYVRRSLNKRAEE